LGEGSRETRQSRHQRPEGKPGRNQAASIPDVRKSAEWNPENRIENSEGGSLKESELCVANRQVRFDVFRENRDDISIEEVEHVHQDEDGERIPRVSQTGRIGRVVR
jgi:hypothetical protein